tara:strand:+ start:58 stop:456 length:399 start_codon:yes stop_codon:yes gene_type:complete
METDKKKWILVDEATKALQDRGLTVTILEAGASPYSNFDLIAHKGDLSEGSWSFRQGQPLVSVDPQTAYKGRHAKGRLFLAVPDTDGWVKVSSQDLESAGEGLRLADGSCWGKKPLVTVEGLFNGLDLEGLL